MKAFARARHRGRHGREHIDRQRLISLIMISTGIARMTVWASLICASLLGVTLFTHLFQQVFWTAMLSLYANLATDLSTVAGSWASLVAGDSHADIEHLRESQSSAFAELERDLDLLAAMPAGAPGYQLAGEMKLRLRSLTN